MIVLLAVLVVVMVFMAWHALLAWVEDGPRLRAREGKEEPVQEGSQHRRHDEWQDWRNDSGWW